MNTKQIKQILPINNYLDVDHVDYWDMLLRLSKRNINTIQDAVDICKAEILKHYQHSTDLELLACVYTHYLFLFALLEFERARANGQSIF
jgi:predicted RNA-binding protein with EMAP domain